MTDDRNVGVKPFSTENSQISASAICSGNTVRPQQAPAEPLTSRDGFWFCVLFAGGLALASSAMSFLGYMAMTPAP
jgi:hypothetical protein